MLQAADGKVQQGIRHLSSVCKGKCMLSVPNRLHGLAGPESIISHPVSRCKHPGRSRARHTFKENQRPAFRIGILFLTPCEGDSSPFRRSFIRPQFMKPYRSFTKNTTKQTSADKYDLFSTDAIAQRTVIQIPV